MIIAILQVLTGPIRVLRSCKDVMSKLRFMCKHIDQKSNEVVFRKCVDPPCSHCTEHLIISTKSWDYLKKRDFKWPNPTPNLPCPCHYKTYLVIDELDAQHYRTGFLKDFPIKLLNNFGVNVLILLINLISFQRNWGLHQPHPQSNYTKIISPFHLSCIAKKCTGDEVGIALTVTD